MSGSEQVRVDHIEHLVHVLGMIVCLQVRVNRIPLQLSMFWHIGQPENKQSTCYKVANSSFGNQSVTPATLPSGRCDTLITKDGEIVQFIMCTPEMDSNLGG